MTGGSGMELTRSPVPGTDWVSIVKLSGYLSLAGAVRLSQRSSGQEELQAEKILNLQRHFNTKMKCVCKTGVPWGAMPACLMINCSHFRLPRNKYNLA